MPLLVVMKYNTACYVLLQLHRPALLFTRSGCGLVQIALTLFLAITSIPWHYIRKCVKKVYFLTIIDIIPIPLKVFCFVICYVSRYVVEVISIKLHSESWRPICGPENQFRQVWCPNNTASLKKIEFISIKQYATSWCRLNRVTDSIIRIHWIDTALCAAGGPLNVRSVSNVTNQIAFQNAVIQGMFHPPAANALKPGTIEISLESGCFGNSLLNSWVIDGLKLKTESPESGCSHLAEDIFTLIQLHEYCFILLQISLTLFLSV